MSDAAEHSDAPQFELRHRLARALEVGEVSNEQMAAEIDRGITTIRNYLKGRTKPGRTVLIVWAMRCGVPFDWLAYGIETTPDTPGEQGVSRRACYDEDAVVLGGGVEWGGRRAA